ncbi:DUF3137 domain-containing protein [Anaerorhabdus sp.]|uniref:DUF3137 domain-containing protein n=1 Tax=Anaerorhabdus sp. TaxID=1872524 RepID=UPI002FCB09DF
MNKELIKIESYRVQALIWNVASSVLGVCVILAGVFSGTPLLMFIGVGVLIGGIMLGSSKTATYRHEFKDYFIRSAFERNFESRVKINWEGMDLGEIEEAFVIPYGNSNRSDDEVVFDYKGIHVRRTDVSTERVVSNGKTTTRVQLFKGQYMVFSFPKPIMAFTVVRENKWFDSKPGGLFSGCPSTEKVELESVEFNKEFVVFSSDPHEAFYLLTPPFMEILLDFQRTYGVEVFFGFMRNEFHVAINSEENLFEPSILVPVKSISMNTYDTDILKIKRVIDQLNLIEEGE